MKRDLQLEFPAAPLAPSAYADRHWRLALPLLAFSLLWIIGWYAATAKSMSDTWSRSETFTHGYVVPAIVLWLVWRVRDQLALVAPRPCWWALLPIAGAGFVWLVGELGAVNAVSQFALTCLIVLTVVAVLGTAVARKIAFPLGFLFFAVPIGEFFLPYLMEWTADFTVFALRLTGIPVYREGQQLVIPTGVWSVVEACSGLRYLVASLMVGTLFAYLMYRSTTRRLMFVGVAIAVPIVANWLRAYMIVMLGHLSSNQIAVGVDHLIYGWLFFGVVIGLMFWIGAKWQEAPATAAPSAALAAPDSQPDPQKLWRIALAVAALAIIWKIGYVTIERSNAASRPQLVTLAPITDWVELPQASPVWRPQFVNPAAEVQRAFVNGEQSVGLVISYYRNQDYDSKLVSSENKLVMSDDPAWLRVRSGMRHIDLNGRNVAVRTTELRGANGRQLVVWQWYWINGRLTASDHWAKAYTALSRLERRGDDSASIVLYTERRGSSSAEGTLESFSRAASPVIEAALHQTRDIR